MRHLNAEIIGIISLNLAKENRNNFGCPQKIFPTFPLEFSINFNKLLHYKKDILLVGIYS
jgi:hypothetical protein